MLDATDRRIIAELRKDARQSVSTLAGRLGPAHLLPMGLGVACIVVGDRWGESGGES